MNDHPPIRRRAEPAGGIHLSPRMELFWSLRPDMRQRFDLTKSEGRAGYLGYWFAYPDARPAGDFADTDLSSLIAAQEPAGGVPDDGPLPVSRMLHGVWRALEQFWLEHLVLDTPEGRLSTATYWFLQWPCFIPGIALRQEAVEVFLRMPLAVEDQGVALMPAELLMYRQITAPRSLDWRSPGLPAPSVRAWYYLSLASGTGHHRCLLPTGTSVEALIDEIASSFSGMAEGRDGLAAAVGLPPDEWEPALRRRLPELLALDARRVAPMPEPGCPIAAHPLRDTGATVIGCATGELGIGEDSRMMAASLHDRGFPFSLYRYPPQLATRDHDTSWAAHLRDDNPHGINIFCLPAVECMWAAAELGPGFMGGRFNIGYMPWELPRWPEEFSAVLDLFDEVWAPSAFIADALRGTSSPRVELMPPAVIVAPAGMKQRDDFGLPGDRFIFLFMFDWNSSVYRKNPGACLDAFAAAFPRGSEPVAFVLKVMNVKDGTPEADDFRRRCAADPRIILLAETLSRAETLDLMNCCDAFVSLHRAEGFGRCIAEAMALGKPAIATAYSGNLDFCRDGAAFLVTAREVPVGTGEYWYAEGQSWGAPDIGEAARFMALLAEDPGRGATVAAAGQRLIREEYSPQTAGRRYIARLEAIARQRRARP